MSSNDNRNRQPRALWRLAVRTSLSLLMAAVAISACGHQRTHIAAHVSNPTQTKGGAATTASSRRFHGDEDDDDRRGESAATAEIDSDSDFDNDAADSASKGYFDKDDTRLRNIGHVATFTDRRAIVTLVKNYYAAAASDNGAVACSLTYPVRAESLPEDYGPTYSPGATTCAQVLTAVFKRLHAQAASLAEVTDVRIEGRQATVLLRSTSIPASMTQARRRGSTWMLDHVLATPLP